jgi:uncharacterized membrane protein YidH (DUF202 family)
MNKIAWIKTAIAALAGGAFFGALEGVKAGQVSKEQIVFNAAGGAAAVAVAYWMRSPKGEK